MRRDWEKRLVYVHAAYRTIPCTGRGGRSTFDELCEHLSLVNIQVTDRPNALAVGVPILILLCPGVFCNPQLVELLETLTPHRDSALHTVNAESSASRWKQGARPLNTLKRSHPMRHLGSLARIGSVARIAGRPARISRMAGASDKHTGKLAVGSVGASSQPERTIVRLYCTSRHFAYYIAQCAENTRHLSDAGLFSEVFAKWPAAPLLQLAVAAHVIHPALLPWMPTSSPQSEQLFNQTAEQAPSIEPRYQPDNDVARIGAQCDVSTTSRADVDSPTSIGLTAQYTFKSVRFAPTVLDDALSQAAQLQMRRSEHTSTYRRSHLVSIALSAHEEDEEEDADEDEDEDEGEGEDDDQNEEKEVPGDTIISTNAAAQAYAMDTSQYHRDPTSVAHDTARMGCSTRRVRVRLKLPPKAKSRKGTKEAPPRDSPRALRLHASDVNSTSDAPTTLPRPALLPAPPSDTMRVASLRC